MAIFLNFVVKTALIWLVLGGFFCVFSQSEAICNLHSCYKFARVLQKNCTPFSELSNFFVYIISGKTKNTREGYFLYLQKKKQQKNNNNNNKNIYLLLFSHPIRTAAIMIKSTPPPTEAPIITLVGFDFPSFPFTRSVPDGKRLTLKISLPIDSWMFSLWLITISRNTLSETILLSEIPRGRLR